MDAYETVVERHRRELKEHNERMAQLPPVTKMIFTGPEHTSQWNYTADPNHPGDSSQWVR